MDFSLHFTPDLVPIFLTLFVLEVVLGVDNVVFVSILSSKLPPEQQNRARIMGLSLAMCIRVILVLFAGWIITLEDDLFTVLGHGFSGRDLVLIIGGAFLVYKAISEIHHRLEGADDQGEKGKAGGSFAATIAQILALDIVFSLDSVITAVGMTSHIVIIIVVVVLSFGILLFASKFIFTFVNKHPTIKMLALSFLMLIGVFLIAEGFGVHLDKALIYGPMAFAVLVEILNLTYASRKNKRSGKAPAPVRMHSGYTPEEEESALDEARRRPSRSL